VFGGSVCDNAAGQLAFAKLVNALRQSAGMDISVQSGVLSTPVPNAFALPGGRVYQSDGLPATPMGELMFRVTGKEGNKGLSIASGHPLTEDRLARMSQTDRPASGPPLLTAEEWRSLKAICSANPWP